MKKITVLLLGVFIIFVSIAGLLTAGQVSAEGKGDFVKGEVLVKFKEGINLSEADKVHKRLGGKVKETIPGIGVQVVAVKGNVGQVVSAYAKESLVEYAEPNFIAYALVDDTYFDNQWALNNTGQETCNTAKDICTTGTNDADIDAPEAWSVTTGSGTVKIAILDSGVDLDHEDLDDKVVANIEFTDSNTVDDLYGHGTHVAGIAAAETNNAQGVAGVGYSSVLMNVKVLGDSGSGAYSWIANGIIWAADNGAKVINMSLGGSRKSKTLESAVNYAWDKGVVLVAAAGNSNNPSPTYPAKYKNVIAVAATDNNDKKASFSSYGDWVDVAAPGENVYSTFPNHDFVLQTKYSRSNDYDFGRGTSMSTPIVAGIAALVWSTPLSGDSNAKVRAQVEKNADTIDGTGVYWVHGRVNAYSAVTVDQQPDVDDGGNGGGRKCTTPPCGKNK